MNFHPKALTLPVLIIVCLLASCKKDKEINNANDQLFDEATASGFTYFDNGDLLTGALPSPHGSFKLRFNAIAYAALDTSGKLPVGATFPNGSLIVKEIFTGADITLLAIMKKNPSSDYASNGWMWAEIKPEREVSFSLREKGDACVSCHNGSPNRDLTRTFDLH